MQDYNMM